MSEDKTPLGLPVVEVEEEMKIPAIEAVNGWMVVCKSANCGPVGFVEGTAGKDAREKMIAEHVAYHEQHNAAIKRVLQQHNAEVMGKPKCPDCNVDIGEKHEDGCDVARCLWLGIQRLSEHDHKLAGRCGEDVWTGQWPGESEAAFYGLTLNELQRRGYWDRDKLKWVVPDLEEGVVKYLETAGTGDLRPYIRKGRAWLDITKKDLADHKDKGYPIFDKEGKRL